MQSTLCISSSFIGLCSSCHISQLPYHRRANLQLSVKPVKPVKHRGMTKELLLTELLIIVPKITCVLTHDYHHTHCFILAVIQLYCYKLLSILQASLQTRYQTRSPTRSHHLTYESLCTTHCQIKAASCGFATAQSTAYCFMMTIIASISSQEVR